MPLPSVLRIRTAQVIRVQHVTPELFTLTCALPAEEGFAFLAGQWVYLHLLDARGESVARGAFSVASAPVEREGALSFGIKVHGRLTQTFSTMKAGDVIGVQGPFGVFLLPKEPAPLVFLAAGIGVTPFRSLIREALAQESDQPIALIWISKAWDDLLYHQEFLAWQAASGGRFRYHPSLTRDPHPDWTGWRGRLEPWMLEALSFDWASAHGYVCGPPLFMERAKALLAERGVSGKPRFHEERFA